MRIKEFEVIDKDGNRTGITAECCCSAFKEAANIGGNVAVIDVRSGIILEILKDLQFEILHVKDGKLLI